MNNKNKKMLYIITSIIILGIILSISIFQFIKPNNDVPIGHINALENAKECDKYLHLSKIGTYEQVRQHFSPEEARYAISNLKADWNKNAILCIEDNIIYNISEDEIYEYLIYQYHFTPEEAQYAIDNLK